MAVLGCSAMMMVACHSEKKVTTAPAPVNQPDTVEIGRASCRERVCQ